MMTHTIVQCPLFSDLSSYVRRAKLEGFKTGEGSTHSDDYVSINLHNGMTGNTMCVWWESDGVEGDGPNA